MKLSTKKPNMKKLATKALMIEHVIAKATEDLNKDEALFVAVTALASFVHKRGVATEVVTELNYAMGIYKVVKP